MNTDPVDLRADLWRIFIGSPAVGLKFDVPVGREDRLDWRQLDQLPKLVEINYRGCDTSLIDYCAGRREIQRVYWSEYHAGDKDFHETALKLLSLDGKHKQRITLPKTIGSLALHDVDTELTQATAEGNGAGMELVYWYHESKQPPGVIAGLSAIRALSIWHAAAVELPRLTGFQQLQELDLRDFRELLAPSELSTFKQLRRLRILNCYQLNSADWPSGKDLPRLEAVELDGVAKSDVAEIVERLGSDVVSVRHARDQDWIRANLDNPFRDWEEYYGRRPAQKISRAFKKAWTQIKRCDDGFSTAAQTALQEFLAVCDAIHESQGLDTIAREQIVEAYWLLVGRLEGQVDEKVSAEFIEQHWQCG